ncbi:MAG TPA: CHASE3 domain-containing protein [Caulifigura sp.]|nr:CHASE3 domain-containing protein [Caulifigura sp.]
MKRSFVGSGMTLGFALAAVVIVASGLLIRQNLDLIARNEANVVHTYDVLAGIEGIRTSLNLAESSQRGYLITADQDYLAPYRDAVPQIHEHLASIATLTKDNPEQVHNILLLAKSVNERLDSLAEGIGILENDGREAARDFILKGRGFGQMQKVRDNLNQMAAEEKNLLAERDLETQSGHTAARRTTVLTTVIGLSMVLLAWFLSLREVTQREAMADVLERRVRERTLELADANTSLKNSNRELEQFASVASHDLQEPLRKIEAFGDRLKMSREALNEQSRDYLDRILSSATRMRTLINDLLSFSRVATRAQPFKPVQLAVIAKEVVGDLEGRLQQTQGLVELGELPEIEADPTQMRQLFQNLIGNALKFHRDGVPPVVRVSAAQSESLPENVTLTVADNGIGFEEQYLDRIFEVFQRLHGRNEFEGTGIGLAICRKIVERHGGSITARSKPGDGSTFLVTLPVKQSGKDESWEAANPSPS